MNPTGLVSRLIFTLALFLTLGCGSEARAQIYVAYMNSGVISEYDQNTGVVMNDMFILGLKSPHAVCLANGLLYVVQTATGYISTYNPETGAAVRPDLVGGLNTPQAMAVDGSTIYVTDFDWQTHQPRIGKYNAFNGAAINPSFIAIAGTGSNGETPTPVPPRCLAASGDKLFLGGGNGPNSVHEYDTNTGAPIKSPYWPALNSTEAFAIAGHWLWGSIHYPAPTGGVMKMDMQLTMADFNPALLRPQVRGIDYPTMIALSGDDLLVGTRGGTAIAKYNATSGALINAAFIPSLNDRLGGLAVVQRELTSDEISADDNFNWHQDLSHYALMAMLHASSIITGVSIVFALGMGVLVAILFRRKAAMEGKAASETVTEEPPVPHQVAPGTSEATPSLFAEINAPVENPPAPAEVTVAPRRSFSTLAIACSVLVVTTLATFALIGYLVMQPMPSIGFPTTDPMADLIGVWRFTDTGDGHEQPVFRSLEIFPTKANYSEGAGPRPQSGTWHDNGFWINKTDGSGEIEVARITDPDHIEVHVNAFIPNRSDVVVLYKVLGGASEKSAIAAKYPGPITYPPPKGTITYYMSEYDLNSLPWRADSLEETGESYSRGTIYHYHSDKPGVPPLEVTVKNQKVVLMRGGYE